MPNFATINTFSYSSNKEPKMKALFIAIMFLCSNTVAAQRAAVSRTTGVPVSCAELDCSEEDSTYQDLDRNCLNCLMRLSDSVMLEEKRKVLQKCEGRKEGCKSFIKDQNTWESKREKMATKENWK